MAFIVASGTYLMQEYFRLSGSNCGSSSAVGKSRTCITSFRPTASKALFQARTPFLMGVFQASGNELSTYQTIGFLTVTF